jgi:hypothetical protein
MTMDSFPHPFYDIEIEHIGPAAEIHLVKVLSIDGRRFTYELRSDLTEDAIAYIKTLIDAAMFGDLIITRSPEGYDAQECRARLKKHS